MKKRLLVFTSTFPRWKDDPKPSFVFELSKRLLKTFDVTVLAPHYPGAKRKESLEGISVCRFKYFLENYQKLTDIDGILGSLSHNKKFYLLIPFFLIAELIALFRYVIEIKPHLIHAHWIIPQGFIAYLNYKMLKTPYIITSHGSDIFGLTGFNLIKRHTLKNSIGVTVVSDQLKSEIVKEIDLELKIDTIPMGVDTDLFHPRQRDDALLKQYKIDGPLLLFVGRLAPEKGIEYIIEAMPKIIERYQGSKLLIIGSGGLKTKLINRSKAINVQNHIVFIDNIPNKDLPRYYATADAFVCPSLREGSPVSYIEALACGTPIVVGDLPISRQIAGEKRGFTVKLRNPMDIANKIFKLLDKKNISKAARYDYIRANYDWNVITNQYLNLLTS